MSGYIGTQPVPQATQTRDSFTATSGQTSFATGGYTPNFLDVYLNGVKLASADYTATNGSDVVLASGAATGDILEVVAFTTFNSASSSIDDNGTGTALTIDSSGHLMVGTTAQEPAVSNDDSGFSVRPVGTASISRTSGASLDLNRKSSDGDIAVFRKDGASVGSISAKGGDLGIGLGTAGLRFFDQQDAILPYNSTTQASDDNVVILGRPENRFKDAYLSGGVYLGGTGAANKLSDYEHGTWSPFWCNGAGQAIFTVNPSVNMARYIKIGKQVTVSCYFNMPTTFSTTSNYVASAGLQIGGLPFGANGNGGVNDYYAGSVGWYSSFSSSYNSVSSKTPMVYTKTNTNLIELGHANGIGHAGTLQEHVYNANSGILLTISYQTNS